MKSQSQPQAIVRQTEIDILASNVHFHTGDARPHLDFSVCTFSRHCFVRSKWISYFSLYHYDRRVSGEDKLYLYGIKSNLVLEFSITNHIKSCVVLFLSSTREYTHFSFPSKWLVSISIGTKVTNLPPNTFVRKRKRKSKSWISLLM